MFYFLNSDLPIRFYRVKVFTLRALAEAIGRTEATIIGEPVRSASQGIDGLWKVNAVTKDRSKGKNDPKMKPTSFNMN